MPFNISNSSLAPRRRLARKAALLAMATVLLAGAPVYTAPVLAGDLDLSTSGAAGDDGQFVRIGLNKSVVIRLPADVKDVIVGNPAIVDAVVRNKNTAYLFARSTGQTNIFFFNAAGQQIMNLDLEVALDTKALEQLIQRTIPGSQITVDSVNSSLVLGGSAASGAEVKIALDLAMNFANASCECQVVNTVNITGGDQVMVKVRIVEIKRSVVKNLGVDLSGTLNIGDLAIAAGSFNPASAVAGAIGATITGNDFSIDAAIEALESEGLVRTLAEPNLTAVSGQSAQFNAGGEVEVGTGCSGSTSTTTATCSTEFKPYGVALNFTPTVLSEGRISLSVSTTVSERGVPTSSGNENFDTRNMSTTIELPSGGSMMLAGLIKSIDQHEISGTPGLKNLPVLGALFRSRSFQNDQSELAIIVTPYIVNPVAERKLKTPDERFNIATDKQSLLWGRLNKVYGPADSGKVFHGNVGYIIE